jgi:hypothetical protein
MNRITVLEGNVMYGKTYNIYVSSQKITIVSKFCINDSFQKEMQDHERCLHQEVSFWQKIDVQNHWASGLYRPEF